MALKAIVFAGVSLLLSSLALAAHIDLSWDPNTEPDVAGYIVYYGTSSGDYTEQVDVGNSTAARITRLTDHTEYFFALAAYDFSGNESDLSKEVSGYSVPGDDLPSEGVSTSSSSGGGCFVTAASRFYQVRVQQPGFIRHSRHTVFIDPALLTFSEARAITTSSPKTEINPRFSRSGFGELPSGLEAIRSLPQKN